MPFIKYSCYNDRGTVNEGWFKEQPSHLFKAGDWFLTQQVCARKNVRIMQRIKAMEIAYYFNGVPIYDFIVEGGSSYKSNLLHTSLYDPIVNQ